MTQHTVNVEVVNFCESEVLAVMCLTTPFFLGCDTASLGNRRFKTTVSSKRLEPITHWRDAISQRSGVLQSVFVYSVTVLHCIGFLCNCSLKLRKMGWVRLRAATSKFLQLWRLRRLLLSVMRCRVVWLKFTDVSEEPLQIKKTVVEVTVDVPVFRRVRKTAKSDC